MKENLKKILNNIKETEKGIKRLQTILKKILNLAKDPLLNVYKIEPLIQNLEKGIKDTEFNGSGLIDIIKVLKTDTERLKKDFRFDFSQKLEELLKENGMHLHGQLPVLYTSFYRIEADYYQGKALLFFGPEKIGGCTLSSEEITKTIIKINKELSNNSIKEDELIQKLFKAWRNATLIQQRERIPITTVLIQLAILLQRRQFYQNPSKSNYRNYSRFQFAYDLYRIGKKGVKQIQGKELHLVASTFDATRKKIDYIWIPTNESGDGVNYSYLTFR